jgi:hypothetical protein
MDYKTTPSKVIRALQVNRGLLSIKKNRDGFWCVVGPGTQFWDKTCLEVTNFHKMPAQSWVFMIHEMEKPIEYLTIHHGSAVTIHWKRRLKDNSKVPDGCTVSLQQGGSIYDSRPFLFRVVFEAVPTNIKTLIEICLALDEEAKKVRYTSRSTGLLVLSDWLHENQYTSASEYLKRKIAGNLIDLEHEEKRQIERKKRSLF